MSRTARASGAGYCYHVLNRKNARSQVFHKSGDYEAFLQIIGESSMRLLAYCLMPNHFHLVVRPFEDGDLSRGMQWLMTTHVRRHLKHYGHSGHVWQGHFQAFPIEEDDHLITVVRYVEQNPVRARLGGNEGPGRPGRLLSSGSHRCGLADFPHPARFVMISLRGGTLGVMGSDLGVIRSYLIFSFSAND